MGGDFAPSSVEQGVKLAFEALPSTTEVTLFGTPDALEAAGVVLADYRERLHLMPCPEVIPMGEHPVQAVQKFQKSSIVIGAGALAKGLIDGFASAGNTGATMVATIVTVKPIPGILRPSIMTIVPKTDGGRGILLDVGANSDCKPEHLVQFGLLGDAYARNVLHINRPKVALLNIGEEAEKGNALTQATYKLLQAEESLHFVGNIEGRDIFNEKADVIVCDGFVGNVVLKMAENAYVLYHQTGVSESEHLTRLNYEIYGGSAVLGLSKPLVIGHGISSPTAIMNMVIHTHEIVASGLCQTLRTDFESRQTAVQG